MSHVPTQEAPSPPETASRYQFQELLGRGGMGEVYRAWDRELEVPVALKSLRARHASDPRILSRFKREAKLARRIKHVNVAQMFDLVDVEGTKYLVMEHVDGKSLREIIDAKGRLPVHVALAIMRQVCSGLQAAHDAGVVHRDLKPHNVMIARRDGRACILDFGIAREENGPDETEAGIILGSPQYMSYEQLAGRVVGPPSDIYQLGILLYEMVTGISPFRSPGATPATLRAMREVPPDPRNHDRRVPDHVASAILACLAKDPMARPRSAAALAELLSAPSPGAPAPDPAALVETIVETERGPIAISEGPSALVAMAPGPEREATCERLTRMGLAVTTKNDGMAALDAAFARPWTLIVLDAALPLVDGLTACQLLRRSPHGADARVLVVVGPGDPGRESFAREVGASDVVRSPLNVHAFARAARSLLSTGAREAARVA